MADSNRFITNNRGEVSPSACCNPFAMSGGGGSANTTNSTLSASSSEIAGGTIINHQPSHFMIDEAYLAREMTELSVDERAKVFDDIHGVAEIREETPEFLERSYRDMNSYLERMSTAKRKNLNRAFFLCPKLQDDTAFKLMFLRADQYDARKAAERMIRYHDKKRELFGEEKLAKKITIDDLSEEDIYVIKSGFDISLPATDQTGRPLFFIDGSKIDVTQMSAENMLRSFWYLAMCAIEDNDMGQKLGICSIGYLTGKAIKNNSMFRKFTELARRRGAMAKCIPVRCTGLRICYDNPNFDFLINTIRLAVGRFTRLRVRTHLGSDIEHDYFLMSFGIPSGTLIQDSQNGKTVLHEQYLQRRRAIDDKYNRSMQEEEEQSQIVFQAKLNDVLIGRGVPYQQFPGNVLWHELVLANLDRYAVSEDAFAKTCISMELVKKVKDYGGRFLRRTAVGWKILDDQDAREKAASAFRTRMRPTSSRSKKTTMLSSSSSSSIPNNTDTNTTPQTPMGAAKRLRMS